MSMIDVIEENFDKEVLKSKLPVIIDLWAEWCGPCRMYSPEIEEAAKEFEGKAKFVKINVDDNQNIATKYNIMSIPTTLIIQGGNVKAENVGAIPKKMLVEWIKSNI
jgi:thioredoxin 1